MVQRSHAFSSLRLISGLVLIYLLAAATPKSTASLISSTFANSDVTIAHGLLGLLMLMAGVKVPQTPRVRARSSFMVWAPIAFIPTWTCSLAIAFGTVLIFPAAKSMALGVLILGVLPVAASSVSWTLWAGGSLPLSLRLLIVSLLLSLLGGPWFAIINASWVPQDRAITWLEPQSIDWCHQLGCFVLVWILTPLLLGMILIRFVSTRRSQYLRSVAKKVGLGIVIALNYCNALQCVSSIEQTPELVVQSFQILSVYYLFLYGIIGQLMKSKKRFNEKWDEVTSVSLAMVLRNTGAGLVFVATVLPNQPGAMVVLLVATPLQHMVSGFVLARAPVVALSRDECDRMPGRQCYEKEAQHVEGGVLA